jgi:hypothetical protein
MGVLLIMTYHDRLEQCLITFATQSRVRFKLHYLSVTGERRSQSELNVVEAVSWSL